MGGAGRGMVRPPGYTLVRGFLMSFGRNPHVSKAEAAE